MNTQDQLAQNLEEEFGLRNAREEWIRRQTAFSPDILTGPICRTDLCSISTGTMPWDIKKAHSVQLGVKVLAQIDDVINIANTDPRSSKAPRVLQLTLNDGMRDFIAVELQPWGGTISLNTIPGSKVVLKPSAWIRRGRVLLREKDFTVLGAPPANIWGPSYETQVAEATVSAGLNDPRTANFDNLNAAGGTNASNLIPAMGIAVLPDSDEEEEEFWAHAADTLDLENVTSRGNGANAMPVPTASVPSHAQASDVESMHEARVVPRAGIQLSNHPTLGSRAPILSPGPGSVFPTSRTESIEAATSPMNIDGDIEENIQPASNSPVADISIPAIPDMPLCDSDHADDEEDKDGDAEVICVDSDAEEDWISVPSIPISRLVNISTLTFPATFRAYTARPERKLTINIKQGELLVFAPLDDGSDVVAIRLSPAFIREYTGISCNAEQFENDYESIGTRIREFVRGIDGFVTVDNVHDELTVTSVSRVPAHDEFKFVNKFADNVEARIAQFLLE